MQLLDEGQQVIGIASRDEVDAMLAFIERHGLQDMVTIVDPDGVVWERFGVFGQPTWGFLPAGAETATVRFGALGVDGVLQTFADGGFA